jgi:dTDP-4-amino-4,6-dideoxygalactose transaminase
MKIAFNIPCKTGNEQKHISASLESSHISGNGIYTKKCEAWFENRFHISKALLTSSCTHALEMSALLLGVKQGDEIIMPSYTFVSTANAFALRGAKIVFVDIRPDTMNIDESKIEEAITDKTKAVVVVHYAGVACEMDTIMEIAQKHNLYVIEDAAQAITSTYKGKPLGTIGHIGTYSFHETKNITSAGEGGLLILNDPKLIKHAEIIREKGTNRNQFFRGEVDKYTWVDLGSSYLLNDISAAYLFGQIEKIDQIQEHRLKIWNQYYQRLQPLVEKNYLQLPSIPIDCEHNGHMFYIKVNSLKTRTDLLQYLSDKGINAVFHYIPLHSSLAGQKYGKLHNNDIYTTQESQKLLRLPLYYQLNLQSIEKIIDTIYQFFKVAQNAC